MEIKHVQDGRNRYCCISGPLSKDSTYEEQMLLRTRPGSLLHMQIIREENQLTQEYCISGLTNLKEYEEKSGNCCLCTVLYAMERLADELFAYMLDPRKVVLDPECIYLQEETGEIRFIYNIYKDGDLSASVSELMEYYIKTLSPEDENGILFLYSLYRKSREPNVTLKTLAEYYRAKNSEEPIIRYSEKDHTEDDRNIMEEIGLDIYNSNEEEKYENNLSENCQVSEAENQVYLPRKNFRNRFEKTVKRYWFDITISLITAAGIALILFT